VFESEKEMSNAVEAVECLTIIRDHPDLTAPELYELLGKPEPDAWKLFMRQLWTLRKAGKVTATKRTSALDRYNVQK
jgi:hypothetical protein